MAHKIAPLGADALRLSQHMLLLSGYDQLGEDFDGFLKRLPTTLFVGNATASSDDSAMMTGRTLTTNPSGGVISAHSYRDESTVNSPGNAGTYGTFDSVTTFLGTSAYTHLQAFQNRNRYEGSGSLLELVGFYDAPHIAGPGTTATRHGVQIREATGTGPITNNIGIYVNSLTRGTTNYAIVTAGDTPCSFGGDVIVNGDPGGTETLRVGSGGARIGGMVTVLTEGITVSAGGLGVGAAPISNTLVQIGGTGKTSGTTQYGLASQHTFGSDATTIHTLYAQARSAAAVHTVTSMHGLYIATPNIGAGSAVTTNFGIYVADQSGGVANYAIFTAGTAPSQLGGSLRIGGAVGFNNVAPPAKATVSGSRGANAALASLLTILAATGLLTDGTSA